MVNPDYQFAEHPKEWIHLIVLLVHPMAMFQTQLKTCLKMQSPMLLQMVIIRKELITTVIEFSLIYASSGNTALRVLHHMVEEYERILVDDVNYVKVELTFKMYLPKQLMITLCQLPLTL